MQCAVISLLLRIFAGAEQIRQICWFKIWVRIRSSRSRRMASEANDDVEQCSEGHIWQHVGNLGWVPVGSVTDCWTLDLFRRVAITQWLTEFPAVLRQIQQIIIKSWSFGCSVVRGSRLLMSLKSDWLKYSTQYTVQLQFRSSGSPRQPTTTNQPNSRFPVSSS